VLILTKIAELQDFLKEQRRGISVGLVPTMGALHRGHISLIETSKLNCDLTICTIFVNPTQFNDKADLARYPRMPEKDAALLTDAKCDVLFMPEVEEIYPQPVTRTYEFGTMGQVLEAKFRRGHFNGVAQVVQRFFEIVNPHFAFFGSKDYQQVMIIKELVKQMHSEVRIIVCPTLREADGLAMSSRNALLTPQERKIAARIPEIMVVARTIALADGIEKARLYVQSQVAMQPEFKLDYYEICDADTLEILSTTTDDKRMISLIAVFVGRIRLIDNLLLR
jgi:pantoate--beta-alanine ligase